MLNCVGDLVGPFGDVPPLLPDKKHLQLIAPGHAWAHGSPQVGSGTAHIFEGTDGDGEDKQT